MSIYITGDCHGDFQRFTTRNFPQLKGLGRDCQRRCGFVVFRRTENVEKWRVKVYSL